MWSVFSSGGGLRATLRMLFRVLSACSLALVSVSWCLDAVLPPQHYREAHYRVRSGTKGWDLLSGVDAQGQVFKVRYLRASGAIPEAPGQRGQAQELLTSRLPLLDRLIGSDLLAVTRLENRDGRGVREWHWSLSALVWWLRVLLHVLGGVICGTVALALAAPWLRWLRVTGPTLEARASAWWRREPVLPAQEQAVVVLPEHPLLATAVTWESTPDPFFPYAAQVQLEWWEVRLNDFPTEPMYTLMIDGNAKLDFDTWPGHWERPEAA